MGMTTRNENKVVNGEFQKRKCRLCAMGNQQVRGSRFDARDRYAPVLKPADFRLLMTIAASSGTGAFKYDTSQAFLYCDVEQDLYSHAPDWWPEHIPEGYCLNFEAQEDYLRDEAGSSRMARQALDMDGGA